MPILSKPSSAARTAVLYVTVGAVMTVWTLIWYLWLRRAFPDGNSGQYYWCLGFFLTGIVFLVIGLALGRIGRSARHAELPPEAPNTPTAEPAIAPGTPPGRAVPGYPTTGQVVVPVPPTPGTAQVAPVTPVGQAPLPRA